MIPTTEGWYIARRKRKGDWQCYRVEYRETGKLYVEVPQSIFYDKLEDFDFHSRIEMPNERNATDGE